MRAGRRRLPGPPRDEPQQEVGERGALAVADRLRHRQALRGQPLGRGEVAPPVRDLGGARQHAGARGRALGAGQRQQPPQPLPGQGEVAAHDPERGQGRAQPQRGLAAGGLALPAPGARLGQPAQRQEQVGVLPLQPVQPGELLGTVQRRRRLLGQGQVVGRVPRAHGHDLLGLHQLVLGVLAQGLQQAVAGGPRRRRVGQHQRLVHQPGQQVQHVLPREAPVGPRRGPGPPPRPPPGSSPRRTPPGAGTAPARAR